MLFSISIITVSFGLVKFVSLYFSSFVLMKECTWFNSMLCHVQQQLHDLKISLGFSSDYKLPSDLADTGRALLAGDVPQSWLVGDVM